MKKKLLVFIFSCLIIFSLTACTDPAPVKVNVSNSENISSNELGTFLDIGNNLVYDPATRIVYIENYTYSGWEVYTAYYAANGLPYRYNPETNTLEEIDK